MTKQKENLKVKILVGLPGSGKSTWAKEFIAKQEKEWVRINRDDFRSMLKNQPLCQPKIETLINGLQDNAILSALNAKCNVIIDNTNLKDKYINHFMELVKHKADIEFMLFDVPAKTCIERDKLRDKSVGATVINRMDKDFQILKSSFVFQGQTMQSQIYRHPVFDPQLPYCYIFDIDGTLAHMQNHRGPFDWNKVGEDEPDQCVSYINNLLFKSDEDIKIIILSGRDESCRKETLEWLGTNDICFDELYMRPANDYRKDNIIKEEIYRNKIQGVYNVAGIFDDRESVCKMWKTLGLKVFRVEENNF